MTSSIYVLVDRSAGEFESRCLGLSRSQTPARVNALLRRASCAGRSYAVTWKVRPGPEPHVPQWGYRIRITPSGEARELPPGVSTVGRLTQRLGKKGVDD